VSSELSNFVTAAYQAILMRDPDPEGLATYIEQLSGEAPDYAAFFASMFGSPEFRSKLDAFLERYQPGAGHTVDDTMLLIGTALDRQLASLVGIEGELQTARRSVLEAKARLTDWKTETA
jgi:hypothetical protein